MAAIGLMIISVVLDVVDRVQTKKGFLDVMFLLHILALAFFLISGAKSKKPN
jgi:hypothetical protein